MAVFTIITNEYDNLPPFQLGMNIITVDVDEPSYKFTPDSLSYGLNPPYQDPEGDAPYEFKLLSKPSLGELRLDGVVLDNLNTILFSQISTGNLVYVNDTITEDTETSFTFDVSDVGSKTYGGLEGNILINLRVHENLPPSVVGDNEKTIDYGEALVFTSAMFTTETNPEYEDPEGDLPLALKILTLPSNGLLEFNGSPVEEFQTMLLSEVDLGYLIYYPDKNDTDNNSVNFEFEVSDTGSGEFSG